MAKKFQKITAVLLAVLMLAGLCACSSGDSTEPTKKQNPNTIPENYEDCYSWNGDVIKGLSSLGRIQSKLVIPARCQGFQGVLLDTMDEELEEVVFEGGYDMDLGAMFAYQTSLHTVVLPDELTVIGEMAFSGCTALEEISIPKSVITISRFAFEDSGVKTVTFEGQALKEIGDKAFYQGIVENITFPDSLEIIGESTFEDCKNLKAITLPKSLRVVGAQAFMNSGILDIYVPAEVELESHGISCFSSSENIITVHVVEGSWMDLNFDQVFDATTEKTYQ